MPKIEKNDTSYTIMEANSEQRQYVFDHLYHDEKNRENSILFVAINESEEIIGCIIARATGDALNSWFIVYLRVNTDYRRRGIGSALFRELQNAALNAGVKDLHGFANATPEASYFWQRQGFCLLKFGRVRQNEGRYFGNYTHYIFRNPENLTPLLPVAHDETAFQIQRADKQAFERIHAGFLQKSENPYFEKNAQDFFGFTATDNSGNIVGFALIKHEPLYPPFSATALVFWVYVIPEMRRRGIGSALVGEVLSYARSIGVSQICHTAGEDSEIPFWQHLRFHVHIHGKSARDPNKSVILTGMRIS